MLCLFSLSRSTLAVRTAGLCSVCLLLCVQSFAFTLLRPSGILGLVAAPCRAISLVEMSWSTWSLPGCLCARHHGMSFPSLGLSVLCDFSVWAVMLCLRMQLYCLCLNMVACLLGLLVSRFCVVLLFGMLCFVCAVYQSLCAQHGPVACFYLLDIVPGLTSVRITHAPPALGCRPTCARQGIHT